MWGCMKAYLTRVALCLCPDHDPDAESFLLRLVPEERISFGINPAVSTLTTVMQIREDYNEVDCRLIAKEVKEVHAESLLSGHRLINPTGFQALPAGHLLCSELIHVVLCTQQWFSCCSCSMTVYFTDGDNISGSLHPRVSTSKH